MKTLSPERKKQIVACLVEGNSIRSTCRITGTTKGAVIKLIEELGEACADFHHEKVRNVASKRVQVDEIWSFIGMKERQAKRKADKRPVGVGDIWTWTAIDADTKLCVSWLVGGRDAGYALRVHAGRSRPLERSDSVNPAMAMRPYLSAVEGAFGLDVDYAMLIKSYGEDQTAEHRYSPPIVTGIEQKRITGFPEPEHISTSFVERQNLTMRMAMRRFTRLTNGFSKKAENHAHAVAWHFAYYNFCRVHQTLRVTPAMEAGLTDHIWSIDELVALLPARCGYR